MLIQLIVIAELSFILGANATQAFYNYRNYRLIKKIDKNMKKSIDK